MLTDEIMQASLNLEPWGAFNTCLSMGSERIGCPTTEAFLPDQTSTFLRLDKLERPHWSIPRRRPLPLQTRVVASHSVADVMAAEEVDLDFQRALSESFQDATTASRELNQLEHVILESRCLAEAYHSSIEGRLARINEAEKQSLLACEAPREQADLTRLMLSLRKTCPSIVKDIKFMAGATKKFEYLRACLCGDDKPAMQRLYVELSDEDREDLNRAFHLADGEHEPFILEIVSEDRRQRAKLGEAYNIAGASPE